MTTPETNISYADLPARWGVTCERDERSLRIVLPPLPSLRFVSPWLVIGGVYVGVLFAVMSMMTLRAWRDGAPILELMGQAVNAAFYGAILASILGFAAVRMLARTIIELDAGTFCITRWIGRRRVGRRVWPRRVVGYAKLNRSNGKLFVQIVGQTFVDLPVSPNREITQWVADQIQDALNKLPPPATSTHGTAASTSSDVPAPLPRGKARTAMLVASGAVTTIGIALVFFKLTPCAIAAWMAAAVPAGIALGMQDKQYYM